MPTLGRWVDEVVWIVRLVGISERLPIWQSPEDHLPLSLLPTMKSRSLFCITKKDLKVPQSLMRAFITSTICCAILGDYKTKKEFCWNQWKIVRTLYHRTYTHRRKLSHWIVLDNFCSNLVIPPPNHIMTLMLGAIGALLDIIQSFLWGEYVPYLLHNRGFVSPSITSNRTPWSMHVDMEFPWPAYLCAIQILEQNMTAV